MTLQPQQTHYPYSTCHRHPTTKPITGFCATCLCERLSSIDSSATATPTSTTSPHHRRAKSYSSTDPNAASVFASASEPCRKSCDVGPRNTLSNLFNIDDQLRNKKIYGPTSTGPPVKEEEEEEIKVCDALIEDGNENYGELKSMKEFIDLELERKKSHVSVFWETASVFSKKLLNWKQKQLQRNKKKQNNEDDENNNKGNERPTAETETQSEIGFYGYCGRRSCDTDLRLPVDNNVRYSFEEPRASWDGCLIGKACSRLITPMAVVEEKGSSGNEGDKDNPGGSEQARDYYEEPLNIHRRRRSFDRCSSGKRASFADVDEVNLISNAKLSPETVGLFHGAKLLVTEKELRDSNWYSVKDYQAECVESDSKNVGYVNGEVGQKGFNFKKSLRQRNVWNMWGLIQKRSESKCGDERNVHRVVDGSLAESWQKIERVANGKPNGTVSEKLVRSYSVSARKPLRVDGVEAKDNGGRGRDKILLPRNRSSPFSPSNLDNGLLRFYLTPVRSYRRSKSGRNRVKNSQSMTMNGL